MQCHGITEEWRTFSRLAERDGQAVHQVSWCSCDLQLLSALTPLLVSGECGLRMSADPQRRGLPRWLAGYLY